MKVTCLIIAGEKSGEEHAMSFITEMKAKKPELHFFGVGGDSLKNEGVEILFHLDEFSTWGVSEAVSKLPFYLNSSKVMLKIPRKLDIKIICLFSILPLILNAPKL